MIRILPECPLGDPDPMGRGNHVADGERIVLKMSLDIFCISLRICINQWGDAIVLPQPIKKDRDLAEHDGAILATDFQIQHGRECPCFFGDHADIIVCLLCTALVHRKVMICSSQQSICFCPTPVCQMMPVSRRMPNVNRQRSTSRAGHMLFFSDFRALLTGVHLSFLITLTPMFWESAFWQGITQKCQ